MKYDKRNTDNIAKLADNTRKAANAWYEDVKQAGIEILIYETIRTLAQQKENVKKGASQTLKSYHLVGQALDWVLVDSKGNTLWNAYNTANGKKVIQLAKKHGFESGAEWKDFYDAPHLQFNHRGYGTDTFGKYKEEAKAASNKNEPKQKEEKIKEVLSMRMVDLIGDKKMDELHKVYSDARVEGILSSTQWEIWAKNRSLSVGDAIYIGTVLNDRRYKKLTKKK